MNVIRVLLASVIVFANQVVAGDAREIDQLKGATEKSAVEFVDGFYHKMLKKNAISVLKENKKRFKKS